MSEVHLKRATNMLRTIASSDLQGRGVYIFDSADLPERFQQDPRVLGWTHGALDISLNCQPRGMAMALNLESIRRRAPDFETDVYGIALHEASHWLSLADVLTIERHEINTARQADYDAFSQWAKDRDFRPGCGDDGVAFKRMLAGHEVPEHNSASFLRAGIHLLWRANRAGFSITADDCRLAGQRYNQSPASHYIEALGDEPKNCRLLPIRNVLRNTSPPAAFNELIERDQDEVILRHLESIPALEGATPCASN